MSMYIERYFERGDYPNYSSREGDCIIEVISKDFRGIVKEKFLLEFQIVKNSKF